MTVIAFPQRPAPRRERPPMDPRETFGRALHLLDVQRGLSDSLLYEEWAEIYGHEVDELLAALSLVTRQPPPGPAN